MVIEILIESNYLLTLVAVGALVAMPFAFNAAEAHPACTSGPSVCAESDYSQFDNMITSVVILVMVTSVVTIFAVKTITRAPKIGYC